MAESGNRDWFRRKHVGYGFTPQTWQGWLITFLPIIIIIAIVYALAK